MLKKALTLSIIALVTATLVFFIVKDFYIEKQIDKCIAEIMENQNINGVSFSTKDRGKKPLLKGNLNTLQKNKLFAKLYQQCNIVEIQDFVETTKIVPLVHSSLNFQIDFVNNKINISGVTNNQNQIDNILSSFKSAIQDNMPNSETPWTLSPDITINSQANIEDFSITITLLFSAIDNIKLTDISIIDKQLTVKGLVRDNARKIETIDKIEQLFSDEYLIINELETVIKHKADIPSFQIELLPPPIVKDPSQN